MKNSKSNPNQFKELVLVPQQMLEQVQENQEKILLAIEKMPQTGPKLLGLVGDKYIPESTAKEMLGYQTTWFWNKRKTGQLPYKKMGNKIYYSLEDIESLIENSDTHNNS